MADDKCIRCRKGKYHPLDKETDTRGREFVLYECEACKSLVIRRKDWNPADWEKAEVAKG